VLRLLSVTALAKLPLECSIELKMTTKAPRTPRTPKVSRRPAGPGRLDLRDAPRAPMPTNVRPMLATLIDKPFDRAGWIFEIKWDGYRIMAELDKGDVRLYSRNGLLFTGRYPAVAAALAKIRHRAVLDGEVVVLGANGYSDFEALQNYRSRRTPGPLVYQLFDILHLDGRDLCGLPLIRRKEILQQILPAVPGLMFVDHIEESGVAFFNAAAKAGLEGMVAKDGASKYLPGRRSNSWLKVKSRLQVEAVIGGFTQPRGSRSHFASLVLGLDVDGELVHIGDVGGGVDHRELTSISAQLAPLVQSDCPFRMKPKPKAPATWVKPELVCEVRFTAWTGGHLRHPVFLAMHEDKPGGNGSP
jgi:bifunctional non-homologous end joining protein LigD